MGGWIRVDVEVAAEAEEAAAEALRALGAPGTEHGEGPAGSARVTAYFPAELAPRLAAGLPQLTARLAASGLQPWPPRVRQEPIDDANWAEQWKEHFHPLHIGALWIRPSWEQAEPPPGAKTMILDPGLAFGTGTHATTRLCLEALQVYLAPGDVVVDVGTGSGILAMAAALLGAGRVVAVDVDPVAVRVARANVELNRLQWAVEVLEGSTDAAERSLKAMKPEGAEVVVGNLLTPIIVELAPDLARLAAPGGRVLASGIAAGQEGEAEAALEAAGLRVVGRTVDEGWVLLVAERGKAG
ncbi:MAG TPA: 50S ribosomal protein L11 methyltransferase [Limnochorda sp.]